MTLDLSKYLIDQSQSTQQENQFQEYSDQPFDLSKYISEESEDWPQYLKRQAVRTGARIGETIAGLPGDIVSFAEFLGKKLPEPPEFLKREPSFLQEKGKELVKKLPTSEKLRETSKELTGGLSEPRTESEQLADEISSLTTSLLIPLKDPTKALKIKPFLKSLGIATASTGAGKTAEAFGASPTEKSAAELGTLFLTSLLGKKMADKFVGELFKDARSKIPEGMMISTGNLVPELEKVSQNLSKGISTATKNEVKSAVDELRLKASGGALPADDLIESYHNLNERMASKKLFNELNDTERKILRHRYDEFKNVLSEEVKDFGKHNKEFYDSWKKANQAYATIAKSKTLTNWLEGHLGNLPKHLAGSVALELFTGHPKIAAATVGSAASIKLGELMYRVANSPKLREHYLNVIKEMSKENLPAVIRNLEKLDKGISQLDKNSR